MVRQLPGRIGAALPAEVRAVLRALPATHPGEQSSPKGVKAAEDSASSAGWSCWTSPGTAEPADSDRAQAVSSLSPDGQAAYRELPDKSLLDDQRIRELAAHPADQQAFLLSIIMDDLRMHAQA